MGRVLKYKKESITIKDEVKYKRCVAAIAGPLPFIQNQHMFGFEYVFVYNTEFTKWLQENEIAYRINYETIPLTNKPYKND